MLFSRSIVWIGKKVITYCLKTPFIPISANLVVFCRSVTRIKTRAGLAGAGFVRKIASKSHRNRMKNRMCKRAFRQGSKIYIFVSWTGSGFRVFFFIRMWLLFNTFCDFFSSLGRLAEYGQFWYVLTTGGKTGHASRRARAHHFWRHCVRGWFDVVVPGS